MDLTPTAAATRPTVPSTPKGVDPGMVKAAREFEAIFVQQLVKAMRQANRLVLLVGHLHRLPDL